MAAPKWDIKDTERDILRARFTLWLDTTLARASAKCRAQMNDKFSENMEIVSMDAFPADYFPDPHNPYSNVEIGTPDFDFAEERLANAFSELPLMRREVLRLLFVEMKTPREIAAIMHCSEEYVRLQKNRAISKLRKMLEEGDNTYE